MGKLIMICGIGASIGMALWLLVGSNDLTATALLILGVCFVVMPFTRLGDLYFVPLFFRLTGGGSLLDEDGHVKEVSDV